MSNFQHLLKKVCWSVTPLPKEKKRKKEKAMKVCWSANGSFEANHIIST